MAQILAMMNAHRAISVIIACAVLATGVVITKLLPKTYTATATLVVNNNVSDPLAGKNADLGTEVGFMPTEMQLIQSPLVLFRVIDQLKLTQLPEYTAGCKGGTAALRDCVLDRLTRDLTIDSGAQGSLLMNVTAAAHDPDLAAQIANSVADNYLDSERQRVEAPERERARRYAQQLAELESKVHQAQRQMAEFRQTTGVADLGAQTTAEEEILKGLQKKLDDAQSARRTAEVKAMGDPTVSASTIASDSVRQLKAQLASEELQLAQLTPTLGANHPKIRELNAQIASTRGAIAEEIETLSHSNSADITASHELEHKLLAAIQAQNAKVLAIRKLRDEGNQYVLALESAQSVYKRALDGYDQIMFASTGNYNYVNLVTHALRPQVSSGPNKKKLAMMAAVTGLVLGIGIPFAYELLLNRRIRCTDDLERTLGIRVLADFGTARLSAGPA